VEHAVLEQAEQKFGALGPEQLGKQRLQGTRDRLVDQAVAYARTAPG
jgi:hypothetical protein